MTGGVIPATASGPWPAPAKLNLLLHVTGRRTDGYHDLQSLFQFLTFADSLYFDLRSDGATGLAGMPGGVPAEQDLTVRAARLLQARAGGGQGVDIHLDKRLPIGAGLGGGSSDAATTLLVLNRLWGIGMEINDLAKIGRQLGADVPVFVHGRAAAASGVGDQLTPVDLPEPWFVVVDPCVSVSTAEIFSDTELTRDTPEQTIADLLSDAGRNDCEAVVCARYPEVAAALKWLNDFVPARMTGTGSCVFGAFETQEDARAVAGQVPDRWNGHVARGVNRSPLHMALF